MDHREFKTPTTLNCTIIENINTIYRLEEFTRFKKDISSLNKNSFDEKGLIIIYEDYIKIENEYYLHNIQYDNLKEIKIINNNTNFWNLIFKNDEEISIEFNSNDKIIENSGNYINQKIINSHTNINSQNKYNLNNNNHRYYNSTNNSQQFTNKNVKTKNKETAIILHLILPGLGYAYLDKIPKFIIVLIPIVICALIVSYFWNSAFYYGGPSMLIFQIFFIVGLIIWIGSLIDTIKEYEKYE